METPWGACIWRKGASKVLVYFEGVCLTTVILAPGASNPGSELRAVDDPTDPLDPEASAVEFRADALAPI